MSRFVPKFVPECEVWEDIRGKWMRIKEECRECRAIYYRDVPVTDGMFPGSYEVDETRRIDNSIGSPCPHMSRRGVAA